MAAVTSTPIPPLSLQWERRDVRALRRSMLVRNRRGHVFIGLLLASLLLGTLFTPAFLLVTIVAAPFVARATISTLWPFGVRVSESPSTLVIDGDRLRVTRPIASASQWVTVIGRSDVERVLEFPRYVAIMLRDGDAAGVALPRPPLDGRPDVLAAIRELAAG
jgi:hypothetical protein